MSSIPQKKYAIVVAVGPGPEELERLTDLSESIAAYAPEMDRFVLIDDAQRPKELRARTHPSLRDRVAWVPTSPVRDPVGWRDRLTTGIWKAFRHLAGEGEWEFVLKVDTDSLLIAPPAEAIRKRFAQPDRPSLIGNYYSTTTTSEEGWKNFQPYVEQLRKWLSVYRDPVTQRPKIYCGCGPRGFRRRNLLQKALQHGYVPSEHCQGGGYALTGEALATADRAGIWQDEYLWTDTAMGEDTALALSLKSLGLKIGSANRKGEPFGVVYRGLVAPPDELLRSSFAIIHCLRGDPHLAEPEIRSIFAKKRKSLIPTERSPSDIR